MEGRDKIKPLSDQDMDGVLGGAVGLGGWGTKDYTKTASLADFDLAPGSSEALLGVASQNVSKDAGSTV